MKLRPETIEANKKRHEQQLELPNMPPPMTQNRARDFTKPCERCEVECDYCIGWKDFDPLGR